MKKYFARAAVSSAVLMLAACGGDGDDVDNTPSPPDTAAQQLSCDDSIKSKFKPDALTSVLLVKAFKQGEPLLLSGSADSTTPIASADVCVVKLLVGPGIPGPVDAPSTSQGIGIEVWLPAKAAWNDRIHVTGGGGWVGGTAASTTALSSVPYRLPFELPSAGSIAMGEGAVSSFTDTGHTKVSGDFAMNPDGTINTVGWKDYAERGIHEQALKTKALTKAYYGRDAKFSYWEGGSTSGRQGMKEAQANPNDFDGIVIASPVINWPKFTTYELYPQIVFQRDLAGVALTQEQGDLVGQAAISACDLVGGQHLGYIIDSSACRYDPTKDAAVLCAGAGGTNNTSSCLSLAQATAVNKIWYGVTSDGSVPDPAIDNGWATAPTGKHKWYGLPRGTSFFNGLWGLGTSTVFTLSTDMVALNLQNPTLADPSFVNATGNGADGWKSLSYEQLSNAMDRGVALQESFGNIATDNTDLSGWKNRNGKMLVWHGVNDELVPVQGIVNYFERVAQGMGGPAAVQDFFRLYLVPGQGHSPLNGTANPNANPPLAQHAQMYKLMTEWVEKGSAPNAITIPSVTQGHTGLICPYPQKITYSSGAPTQASSFRCQ